MLNFATNLLCCAFLLLEYNCGITITLVRPDKAAVTGKDDSSMALYEIPGSSTGWGGAGKKISA